MNRKLAFALVLSAIAIAGCKREAQPAPVAPAAAETRTVSPGRALATSTSPA